MGRKRGKIGDRVQKSRKNDNAMKIRIERGKVEEGCYVEYGKVQEGVVREGWCGGGVWRW